MSHVIVNAVFGAVYGAVAGLTWWLALGTVNALSVSAVIGASFGALIGLVGAMAARPGGVNDRESMFVSGMLLALAGLLGGVVGLAVWAVRALFG